LRGVPAPAWFPDDRATRRWLYGTPVDLTNDAPPDHDTRIAYLTSQYPATSHTHPVARSGRATKLGLQLGTFSIRPPASAEDCGTMLSSWKRETRSQLLDQPAARSWVLSAQRSSPIPPDFPVPSAALRHRPPGVRSFRSFRLRISPRRLSPRARAETPRNRSGCTIILPIRRRP